MNELGWEILHSDGWKVQKRVGFFWFCRVCILRLREIFVEDFRSVYQADAAKRQYMAMLAEPDTHIDVETTLSFKRNLPPNEQGMLDSVLSGSCRWQLRQQGSREKLNTVRTRGGAYESGAQVA